MTKWNCSISATPPRIARPRSASAATMPQNSRFARCSSGTREVAEQQQEDEQVVERQRALDEVDRRVGDRVVGARRAPTPAARPAAPRTSQPIDHTTPSRNVGSRPGANSLRSTSRSTTVMAASASHGPGPLMNASGIRRRRTRCPARRTREQLHALEPGRLALVGHLVGDQDRQEDRPQLEPVEHQRHRERPDEERQQHEHRRGEQRDLGARADRDVDGQVHLVLPREVDRHPVLGGVADDRHDDDRDEERRQADALRRLLDRADEDLRHHADRDAGERERDHALAHRPRLGADVVVLAVRRVEEVAVRLEREQQPGGVRGQQHERDERRHRLEVGREAVAAVGRDAAASRR